MDDLNGTNVLANYGTLFSFPFHIVLDIQELGKICRIKDVKDQPDLVIELRNRRKHDTCNAWIGLQS